MITVSKFDKKLLDKFDEIILVIILNIENLKLFIQNKFRKSWNLENLSNDCILYFLYFPIIKFWSATYVIQCNRQRYARIFGLRKENKIKTDVGCFSNKLSVYAITSYE